MKWLRKSWPYVVLLLLIALNGVALLQRQWIGDWWRLRDYTASADIATLVTNTTMTDRAQRFFYINHPVLEDKAAFNAHCADRDKETTVLGCYHGNRLGIYLYAVTDERLNGVREVTAAHEMLHQAYDRLSSKERVRVTDMLEDFYASQLSETDVKSKIDSYKKQDKVDLVSEMHSIFGSEVRSLPDELNQYYSQYFTNRDKVVDYSDAYQSEFTRRKELVNSYDTQLASLKVQIDDSRRDLSIRMNALEAKEDEIDQDISTRDVAQYQADVAAYNNQVESYNAKINATRRLIDQYNVIVGQRNEIAVEEQELQQALDSSLTPAATQ